MQQEREMKGPQECYQAFNEAVTRFFDVSMKKTEDIVHAATEVFEAREKLSGLREDQWDHVIQDMKDVGEVLSAHGLSCPKIG
jgi:hypothetical protein